MCEPAAGVVLPYVNVGIDLEDVARFSATAGRPGASTDVLFDERELAHARADGQAGDQACESVRAARLTGTWCAKEAVVKALWPWARLDPRRVTVVRDAEGRPTAEVSGQVVERSGLQVQLSISHTSTYASAVAVAWGPPPVATPHRVDEELPA